jgi:LuxR family maltose regulon positive regulatory protein
LPLARLRVHGQLVELRERDLRFNEDETAALLREAAGLELPAASLAALLARTEGWAAGLQPAAFSPQRDANPPGFVAKVLGQPPFCSGPHDRGGPRPATRPPGAVPAEDIGP